MKSVHFVCRGNVFRSRLAEAYMASILGEESQGKVSSSGIEAAFALNGAVDPEAVRLLQLEKIQNYLTPMWHQTTQNDINDNELIIFMSQTLYEQAKELFEVPADKAQVWEIPDINGVYPMIKNKVDALAKSEF